MKIIQQLSKTIPKSLTISLIICTPTTSVIVTNIRISGFSVFQACLKPINRCHFGVIFKSKTEMKFHSFNYSKILTVITLFPVSMDTLRKGTTTNPIISRPALPTQKHSTLIGILSDFILDKILV